jgi:hypothetical protein
MRQVIAAAGAPRGRPLRQIDMVEGTLTLDASGDEAGGDATSYDGLTARGYDDLLISATLTALLDKQQWPGTGESGVVEQEDVMRGDRRWRLVTRPLIAGRLSPYPPPRLPVLRPPAADVLDGAEGLGDGFLATKRGEDGREGVEVGEQIPARTAGQEAEEGDAVLGFGPEASERRARKSNHIGGQPCQRLPLGIFISNLARRGQCLLQQRLRQVGSQPGQHLRRACRRTMALFKLHDIPQTFRGVIVPQESEH